MANHGESSTRSTKTTATMQLDPVEKLMQKNDYNSSSWEGSSLAAELLAGRDLAKQLQLLDHYHREIPSSSTSSGSVITTMLDEDHRCHELQEKKSQQEQQQSTRQGVTQKILESYDNALSLLSQYHSSLVSQNDAASPSFKIPPTSSDDKRGTYQRRQSTPKWQVEVTLEDYLNDGFTWRKYGHKDILGSKYPRSYFRCTHKYSHGCKATKQAQRADKNPAVYEVTYIGSHTCPGIQDVSEVTWSPSPASSVTTCGEGEGSPLFFDSDSEFGEVEEASATPHTVLRPQPRTKFPIFDLNQTWEQKDDAMLKLDGEISRCEELIPELHFSEFMPPEFDAYGIYGNKNDGMSDKATNLDLDLGLGARMSSSIPTNLKGPLGIGSCLDLGIEMFSVPDCGTAQSLQSQVVSFFELQEDITNVSDRMLDLAESIQIEVKEYATSFEFKPSHCNSMMVTQEQLYISKSPSLKFCSAHNFVSLFFSYCKLPQLWKGGEQLLVSLKRFDAKHSDLLWIPNLSKARKLESLNLEGCANLVGISSIQYLTD